MSNIKRAEHRILEAVITGQRADNDYLVLSNAVMLAALEGTRHLTEAERRALQASPLTLRRFGAMAAMRGAGARAKDGWAGSHGMLRAASGGDALAALSTDDGHWALHFIDHPDGWRVVLTLDGGAPFAVRLMREQPMLRVVDGGGAIILQGSLDADGECECAWPFETAPAPHFHEFGAGFSVEPVH